MTNLLYLCLAGRKPRSVQSTAHHARPGNFPRRLVAAILLLSAVCTSCGAVGSAPAPAPDPPASDPPPPVTVTVTPSSAQPFPGASVQFKAVVQNASSAAVNWQVNAITGGNATAGTIDSMGLYTAPASLPNPPTVTVTAVLQSDATKSGSASVTIQALSAVTGPIVVSPSLSSVTTSQTIQFNVLTPGLNNSEVTWTSSGGTITASGNFTPPGTAGAYTIQASLPNTQGFATVEVTNYPGTLTWRNDNSRSGINSQELALSPATVSSATFGKLFSCPIDGYAYAEPL
jgi:hypothetical protein